MPKSTYYANAILDHGFGGPDFVRPETLYISLHTQDPGLDGSGAEVSTDDWTNYARVAVDNDDGIAFPPAANGQKATGVEIDFGNAAIDNDVTVTHFGVWDAAIGGNLLVFNALQSSKIIQNGDPVKIPLSQLLLQET